MRIAYHLGAHCTDEEKLLRCLLKNRGPLAEQGILVPGPSRYRVALRDALVQLKGQPADEAMQAMLLEQIMEADEAERLVLSWDSFMAFPQWAVRRSLYPNGPERLRALTRIFPQIEAEFFLAIRNPAGFLPAMVARQKDRSYEDIIAGTDPLALRWSELITRIRNVNPEVPLTVWCDEDSPLIWPEVLQAISGHAPGTELEGADDLLGTIMTPRGFGRLKAYLEASPPPDAETRRRAVTGYLQRFALPEQIETEVDLPGWTDDYVAHLTEAYDRDVARIVDIPGVRLITA
ncbi:hypothetical protein L0V05_11945 [Tabrizicola sp. J26]|uniref:hypothetical protein n=1 Tax=Alitabrizicola rongguiensis TaxID=2909234 RepID=UPI001F371F6D|nr:hypothetical protein [Tabrizicola rongguiensis]MCF1709528.1 hypothetical protein [Tabrizicola rongguiensis]